MPTGGTIHQSRSVTWSPDGTATAIGSAYEYTTAVAVNDAGVSVGHTGDKVASDPHRFALRYEADGSLTELNVTPDGSNSYATFINSAGVAVGVRIAFPTPGSPTSTAVIWRPEPRPPVRGPPTRGGPRAVRHLPVQQARRPHRGTRTRSRRLTG